MHHIVALALPDAEASALTGPLDVLNAANSIWRRQAGPGAEPLFSWELVTPQGRGVTASNGLGLAAARELAAVEAADALLLGGVHFRGTRRLFADAEALAPALRPLQALAGQGALIASSCTGTVLLAEAGLLDGRRATTSWWLKQAFRQRYPRVRLQGDQVVVQDRGLLTAGAATSHLNLALELVRSFAGEELALFCAKTLLIDGNRGSQAPYAYLDDDPGMRDPLVLKAQHWIQIHLREPVGLERVAEALAVSPRTLIRHFKRACGETPAEYIQRLRVDHAQRLLERTGLSLEAVSERVGYRDYSTFRRAFRRVAGVAPSAYRQRFQISG